MIRQLTELLHEQGIETVSDLRARYDGGRTEREFRRALTGIRNVSPKTRDYIGILAGADVLVAVDRHMRAFVREAGVTAGDYTDVAAVVRDAANEMGVSVSSLDAAIWRYMSTRGTRTCE